MKPLPPILDQGSLGACQTYAVVNMLGVKGVHLDPVELYHNAYKFNQNRDPGIEDVLKYLQSVGTIRYVNEQYVGTWKTTLWNKVQFISTPRQIAITKNLCKSNGAVISCNVPFAHEIAPDGVITKEQILHNKGREHAMYLYDYNDEKQLFTLVNSWGTNYGDHSGCIYLPYNLINITNRCFDFTI
jgi:hypothetical protein